MSHSFRLTKLLPRFLRIDKQNSNRTSESKGGPVCKVIFLDETDQLFPFKSSHKGLSLLDKVFSYLNLEEKDYFGLRYLDTSDQTHWLDPFKSLSSQLKLCNTPYILYFGVKFYPADPCKVREEITRYQFFLQVKRDILQGRLPLTFDEATELFAYAVQSELGDYDPQRYSTGYISEFRFVPNQTEELEERISACHRRLVGLVPTSAEYKFLDKVKWYDMYGVDLHPVLNLPYTLQGEGNQEYFLGLTPTGIVVYKNKTKVGNYFWPRITKVTFKQKIFIIKVKDKNSEEHTYAFELGTKAACKHLWKCCVEHHAFFRLNQVADALSISGKHFRSSSRRSKSGRQSRDTQSESGRSQPDVPRAHSKRYPRRTTSDSRLSSQLSSDGLPYMQNDRSVSMVAAPEYVKGPRHRSLPELHGSPKSTRSAPWEVNTDVGLYTSGRDSPVSMYSDANKFPKKSQGQGSDTESGHRRKYFPKNKGSDNESDVSFSRRIRREVDSGSESDVSPVRSRHRRPKSSGDWFESQWKDAMEGYYPNKETHMNGSIPSINSAPAGEAKRRRRRRTKSPGTTKRPPEELREHFKYNLVDTEGMSVEQLRDIPFTQVETKAEPFKVKYSPNTRQRYRSPKRKSYGEPDHNANLPQSSGEAELPPPYSSLLQEAGQKHYYSDTNSFSNQRNPMYDQRDRSKGFKPWFPDSISLASYDTVLSRDDANNSDQTSNSNNTDQRTGTPGQNYRSNVMNIRSTEQKAQGQQQQQTGRSTPQQTADTQTNIQTNNEAVSEESDSVFESNTTNRQGPFPQSNERTIRQPLPRSNERTAFSPVNQNSNYQTTSNPHRQDQYRTGLSPMGRTELSPMNNQDYRQTPNNQSNGYQGYNQGKQTSYTNYSNRPLPERPNDSSMADRISRSSGTPERPMTRGSVTPERPMTRGSSGTPERQARNSGTPERPTRIQGTPERPMSRGYGTPDRQTRNSGTPERPMSRGYGPPERTSQGMAYSQMNQGRSVDRGNYNTYNRERSPGSTANQTTIRQNFNSVNKFGNDDKSQEYSQKISPSVRNTGVSTDSNYSYQRTPDRNQPSSNVYSHGYGTQESIKKLYSSPKDSRGMYATQDSIRRMYNSPNDSNYRPNPQSVRGHPNSQMHPSSQQYHPSYSPTKHRQDSHRTMTHERIDPSVLNQPKTSKGRDLWTEI
ncbi:uncharacterized protein [Mytilus edulis]|uniref:uncharacterized protein isoform X4 n=1 Tax=Mytilus edulis TaxID=6550 RepID=UPI0039EFCE02